MSRGLERPADAQRSPLSRAVVPEGDERFAVLDFLFFFVPQYLKNWELKGEGSVTESDLFPPPDTTCLDSTQRHHCDAANWKWSHTY